MNEAIQKPLRDPRDIIGCSCPSRDGVDCICARYGKDASDLDDWEREECMCSCHDMCECCGQFGVECFCADSECDGCAK